MGGVLTIHPAYRTAGDGPVRTVRDRGGGGGGPGPRNSKNLKDWVISCEVTNLGIATVKFLTTQRLHVNIQVQHNLYSLCWVKIYSKLN
jgi:hypothetical protein